MARSPEEFKAFLSEHLLEKTRGANKSFFRKLIEGQLSPAAMKEYYRHLYHECQYFVRFVGLVYAMADERDARDFLAHNLLEELGQGKPGQDHPTLAMHVGKCFGLSEQEIVDHGLFPEVKAAFEDLRKLGFSSFLEGLSVLLVIESDLPLRHALMRQALTTRYGIDDRELAYYHEHMASEDRPGYGGDEVHTARELDLVAKYARTDGEQAAVIRAMDLTFAARDRLVSALDSHCGALA